MANLVVLIGHGRLPQGMAAKAIYDTLAVAVQIEDEFDVIVRASCTLVTPTAAEFVQNLLLGHSLRYGVQPIIKQITSRYYGAAQKALVAALLDLEQTYNRYREEARASAGTPK
jgi:hypothetical protein